MILSSSGLGAQTLILWDVPCGHFLALLAKRIGAIPGCDLANACAGNDDFDTLVHRATGSDGASVTEADGGNHDRRDSVRDKDSAGRFGTARGKFLCVPICRVPLNFNLQ